jgi:hypothetical protein
MHGSPIHPRRRAWCERVFPFKIPMVVSTLTIIVCLVLMKVLPMIENNMCFYNEARRCAGRKRLGAKYRAYSTNVETSATSVKKTPASASFTGP